jgi:hypothetical protein
MLQSKAFPFAGDQIIKGEQTVPVCCSKGLAHERAKQSNQAKIRV